MNFLEICKDSTRINHKIINIIENDEDIKAGLAKAYKMHKEQIKKLPLETQLKICLDTISFGASMLRDHQKEMKKFTDNLNQE